MVLLSLGAAAALGQMGSEQNGSLDERLEATRQGYIVENPFVDPNVRPAQYSPSRRTRPRTGFFVKKPTETEATKENQNSSVTGPATPVEVSSGSVAPPPATNTISTADSVAPTLSRVPRRIKPSSTSRQDAAAPSQNTGSAAASSRRPAVREEDVSAEPISAAPKQTTPVLVEQPKASPAESSDIPTTPRRNIVESRTIESSLPTRPTRISTQQPTPALDSGTKDGDDNAVVISTKSPAIVVETTGPRNTVIGRKSTYKVALRNTGDAAANGVVVQIQGPSWAEIRVLNPSRGTTDRVVAQAGEALAWRITQLPARAREELTLTVMPNKSDAFEMSVAWSIRPVLAKTLIQVQEPKLHMQISGPAEVRYGDTKVYRMIVSNPGTGEAENVHVQLMPLDGGERPMAVQRIGKLAPGEKRELEVELTARQAGHLTIHAIATGDIALKSEATEKVLIRRAGVKLDVQAPTAKFAGTLAAYQIRLSNPGNDVAQQIRMTATLPPGAEFVSSSHGGQLDKASGKVSWSLNSLSAQQEQVVTVKAELTQAGANILQVNAQAEDGLADSASASTEVQALADLKLEVSDPRGPVPVGDEVVYEIRVINRGTKAAQDVEVFAYFSQGVEPVSVHGGGHQLGSQGQVVLNPIATIPVGGEVVYKIVARAVRDGDHTFRAEVQCQEIGTRLATEETTRFFSEAASTARRPANEPTPINGGGLRSLPQR
jgi:uncharacterized repeat protein (TIGR01451 family)